MFDNTELWKYLGHHTSDQKESLYCHLQEILDGPDSSVRRKGELFYNEVIRLLYANKRRLPKFVRESEGHRETMCMAFLADLAITKWFEHHTGQAYWDAVVFRQDMILYRQVPERQEHEIQHEQEVQALTDLVYTGHMTVYCTDETQPAKWRTMANCYKREDAPKFRLNRAWAVRPSDMEYDIFCDRLCEMVGYEREKDAILWIPRANGNYTNREPEPETHADVVNELSASKPLTVTDWASWVAAMKQMQLALGPGCTLHLATPKYRATVEFYIRRA
ncbi:hypothetical protein AbraIFM66951_001573 [Aspergillus brasiliensis]|uniref:Uncharacterized protein n=1 Tax=Aspergillus brasiliensis TaxID=319629 RepID=A0A9W6DQE4_9EURO|nr:hypothetical protein AbraCBS73388_000558 [Aspergillus brasiliensis]GKZ49173.1 hypothetical protein AbraIFM66951_001573 [Aspergillus brasiliensis]